MEEIQTILTNLGRTQQQPSCHPRGSLIHPAHYIAVPSDLCHKLSFIVTKVGSIYTFLHKLILLYKSDGMIDYKTHANKNLELTLLCADVNILNLQVAINRYK